MAMHPRGSVMVDPPGGTQNASQQIVMAACYSALSFRRYRMPVRKLFKHSHLAAAIVLGLVAPGIA